MSGHRFSAVIFLLAMACVSLTSVAQIPLAPPSTRGQTVTPVFEGWYQNPDGTYSLSFGYFNRNFGEVLEIPVGPDNFFEPGPANQGQPTQFQPRRQWGVFAVTVPAEFGYERLVWTLKIRGETFFVPGSLNKDWQIDALRGEAKTLATFSEPGSYVLRVRANDASGIDGAGHAQCCWTNGFVHVSVIQ
ncbi:MAG: hypothetical protein IH912_02060 [Proteobacteria bacterium]|nr:hypothetical protein [Pseudomonadota bacterium]